MIISNGGYLKFKIGKSFKKYLRYGKIFCTNGVSTIENYCEIYESNGNVCPNNCNLKGNIKLRL